MTHTKLTDDHLQRLKENTSAWFPTEGDTEKLFIPAANSLGDLDEEIKDTQAGLYLETATTFAEVEKLGKIVGVRPADSDTLQYYKKRVATQYQQLSQAGNPVDILSYASTLFEIDEEDITLDFIDDKAKFKLSAPTGSIQSSTQNVSNASAVFQEITAATFSADIIGKGTLEYITESEYQSGNYDSSNGYDGLDSNGDPKGNGGTYGTLY